MTVGHEPCIGHELIDQGSEVHFPRPLIFLTTCPDILCNHKLPRQIGYHSADAAQDFVAEERMLTAGKQMPEDRSDRTDRPVPIDETGTQRFFGRHFAGLGHHRIAHEPAIIACG